MKTCSVPGCDKPHSGKGLCKKHYDALPESREKARLREKQPHRLKQRKEARETPEQKAYAKNWQLEKQYGITLEHFNKLLIAQDGYCAICKCVLIVPHLDHNHETGKVRGLLCKPCNQGIGFLREDISILTSVINYLVGYDENQKDL